MVLPATGMYWSTGMKLNRKTSHPVEKATVELLPEHQLGLERLIFFSDAVFAIAITLLTLEIRLPATDGVYSDSQLLPQLLGIWHKYLAYAITFLVIGTFWMGHHRKFRYIIRYDMRLLLLNLLFLMTIAFMPFPSSILSTYSNRTATVFYALTMMIASLFVLAMWLYASQGNRLIDSHLDAKQCRRQTIGPLATAAAFLLSIGFAYIDPNLARLSWLLILPASLYAR
jgi:uncharacterized membrane protein